MADEILPTGSHYADAPSEIIPASTKLRRLLNIPGHLIVCPGVYDGFSARVALEVGFDCLYMVRTQHLSCHLVRHLT
jgi:hypothetical protein